MAEPTIEYGIFKPHTEPERCYEWRSIALRDWDRAVEDNYPNAYVIRMLKGGSYYIGHFGYTHKECYANDGALFINLYGYRCESLRIKEGCTVYSQPYNLGEPLLHRAVIASSLANGELVYVASLAFRNGKRLPGYDKRLCTICLWTVWHIQHFGCPVTTKS